MLAVQKEYRGTEGYLALSRARDAVRRERDAVKIRARRAVASAVRRGDLIRPERCEQCGGCGSTGAPSSGVRPGVRDVRAVAVRRVPRVGGQVP